MEEKNRKLLTGYYIFDKKENKEILREYSKIYDFNKYTLKQLSKDLEDSYHLRYNKDNDKVYLFDYDSQSYLEVNDRILQEFLDIKEDIRVNTAESSNLIQSVVKTIKNNYDYVEFDNKLFNLKTYELEDKTLKKEVKGEEYGTNKPRHFIVPKRINHNILSTKNKDFNPENSIVYKTLKQILGTKDNIKDFKQRLGLSIFNTGKEITIYYAPSGNNEKSILLYIRRLILGTLVKLTKLSQLGGEFNHEIINNVHEHQIDEPKTSNYKDTEDMLKKLTGGGMEEETRKIREQTTQTTRLNSHLVIATNPLPDFNLNDTALFNRLSIIELKNTFTYDNSLINNKNVFPINDNIQDELKKDIKGLTHLLYDGIKEYRLMKDLKQNLLNKKGVEYVRAFYLGNDHLINFLNLYVEVTEYETEDTTATEIYNNYKLYIEENNIDLILDESKLVLEIGKKLNKLYGKENIIRKKEDNIRYLKNIKCSYSIGTEKVYKVDPDLEDYNIVDKDYKKIFNLIKKGYNTFEKLKQQEKKHNKIIESVNYLKEHGYIEEYDKLKTNEK